MADPAAKREVAAFASESSPAGMAFLAARGFTERYRLVKWRIDPTRFVVPAWLTPLADGIHLTDLAAVDSPVARRVLFDMIMEAAHDIPIPDAMPPRTFEDWERVVLGADRFDPTAMLIAMDGDRPVGYSRLEVDGTSAWTHFTGVARSHRGRGIAMHLKVEAIRPHGGAWRDGARYGEPHGERRDARDQRAARVREDVERHPVRARPAGLTGRGQPE